MSHKSRLQNSLEHAANSNAKTWLKHELYSQWLVHLHLCTHRDDQPQPAIQMATNGTLTLTVRIIISTLCIINLQIGLQDMRLNRGPRRLFTKVKLVYDVER